MAAFSAASYSLLRRSNFSRISSASENGGLVKRGAQVERHARRLRVTMLRFPWQKDPDAPKIHLNFDVGYAYLAHPEKNTGEDAFFVEGNCAGVFDGVSGAYETRGVDPRLYSQTLAAFTQANVRAYGGAEGVVKAALNAATANTTIGASTASVLGMDEFGRVFGINLGDSGARIIRNGKVIFRTKEQQHFFNCPYQLGTDSEDSLEMGQNVQQKVREGDWIILATDGLFDNVPDRDIIAMTSVSEDPTEVAESLGDFATERSLDKDYVSPFMLAAKNANVQWQGGKVDDITILAIKIRDDASIRPITLLSTLAEEVFEVAPDEGAAGEGTAGEGAAVEAAVDEGSASVGGN